MTQRIIAAFAALTLLLTGTVLVGSPAQADDASARQSFRQIALDALAQIEAQDTGPSRSRESWLSAYQAGLTAFRDGWLDPKVAVLLQRVYDSKTANGYGTGEPTDAFQDGTTNPADTVYTVTVADHVGEPLLDGYDAGVVPVTRLQELADALWRIPVYNTPAAPGSSKCMAYSDHANDQPVALNDNRYWCVINVSAGAAAVLQKLLDRGVTPAGATVSEVQSLIADLGSFIEWAHSRGGAGTGHWAYSYRTIDNTFDPGNTKSPQDLNHGSYTAESAYVLGLPSGTTALNRINNSTDYINADDDGTDDITADIHKYGRNVEGRMRAAGVKQPINERNLLAEALWWQGTTHDDVPTSLAQEGRWAARLAGTATAQSEQEREVDFMSNIRIYPGNWTGRGGDQPLGDTVPTGGKYIVYTDARFYDLDGNLQFITNIPVRTTRNGNLLTGAAKPTGFHWWGVRYVWEPTGRVGSTHTFCPEVIAGQSTAFQGNCKTITLS